MTTCLFCPKFIVMQGLVVLMFENGYDGGWRCQIGMCFMQGRNEVRWRPGQETSSAPPCSNLRSFGSNCTVFKKVLVRLFGLLAPLSARGIVPPCPPRYAGSFMSSNPFVAFCIHRFAMTLTFLDAFGFLQTPTHPTSRNIFVARWEKSTRKKFTIK